MSTTIPKHFDAQMRNQFAQAQEIQFETRRPEANVPPLRRTIWVVVAGEEVFLRSVRENAGRWYQAIKANPVALVTVDGQQVQVQAVPVTDDATLARIRDSYRQQYHTSPYLPPHLATGGRADNAPLGTDVHAISSEHLGEGPRLSASARCSFPIPREKG